jgi:hypothetical protein
VLLGRCLRVANFYEKALFVKPTWRLLSVAERKLLCPSRAMLLSALSVSPLFGDSVHRMRSVFSSKKALQSSDRSLLSRVDQVRNCAVAFRSEARSGKSSRGLRHFTLGSLLLCAWGSPPLFIFAAPSPLLSLSRLLFLAPMRVVERIVDLCRDPEAVQEHRELPRYGHSRSFLGVLSSPRGYLFSMTS